MPKRRNPVACAPIMRKGGVHERSKSGERNAQKKKLRDVISNYLRGNKQERQNRFIGNADESDFYVSVNFYFAKEKLIKYLHSYFLVGV